VQEKRPVQDDLNEIVLYRAKVLSSVNASHPPGEAYFL